MSERKIEVVISAKDDYTIALQKFNAAMGSTATSTLEWERAAAASNAALGRTRTGMDAYGGAAETAAAKTGKMSREFGKLTSGQELASAGLRRFRSMMEGMAFGGAIGLVSGAVSALTTELISFYREEIFASEKAKELRESILSQAEAWGLLPEHIDRVTKSKIAHYNIDLKTAQLDKNRGPALLREIENIEEMYRVMERKKGLPSWVGYAEKDFLRLEKRIQNTKDEYEDWKDTAALSPITFEEVSAGLKAIKSALDLPKGGGSLMAFVMGDLDMAKPKLELTGLEMSKAFMDSFKRGPAESTGTDLSFSMAFVNKVHSSLITAAQDPAILAAKSALLSLGESPGGPKSEDEFSKAWFGYQAQLQALEQYNAKKLLLMQAAGFSEGELAAENARMVIENERKKRDFQLIAASQTFGGLSNMMQNLTVATGKEQGALFKTMQAFAIAQATIDTYRGAAGAFAALSGIPIVGPVLATVAAAAAIAAGLARVQQIASIRPGGTATGSSISSGGVANPSYSGGSPSAYPPPTRVEQRPALNVTVNAFALSPASVDWDELTEKHITPALERLSSDRDVSLNIKVTKR